MNTCFHLLQKILQGFQKASSILLTRLAFVVIVKQVVTKWVPTVTIDVVSYNKIKVWYFKYRILIIKFKYISNKTMHFKFYIIYSIWTQILIAKRNI